MRRVARTGTLVEAHLLRHRLGRAGIAARVMNEHAQGGLGDIPFTHAWPELWLEDERDYAAARAIVARFESEPVPTTSDSCGHCGEDNPTGFELCWNCGRELT